MSIRCSLKEEIMKKAVFRSVVGLMLAGALVLPLASPAFAQVAWSGEVAPRALINDVVDTYRTETCQTTSSHNWKGGYTYRTLTFNNSYAVSRRDVISHKVAYPCHYQANHKAAYTTWKNIYKVW